MKICKLSNRLQHIYSLADTMNVRKDRIETNDNVGLLQTLTNSMHEEMSKELEGLVIATTQ